MLSRLSIRDVVIIEKLDLDFHQGLSTFTGETGAGKSILLDSLSLATGARSDTSLVRQGAEKLSVSASFTLKKDDEVFSLLEEQGLDFEFDEPLCLRRIVTKQGKSKAFINDQAVSAGFLKEVGGLLVEIHGQFATHSLLNPLTHIDVLDEFACLEDLKNKTALSYQYWKDKIKEKKEKETALEKAQAEEEYLRHCAEELRLFDPKIGEEKALNDERSVLMNAEKIVQGLEAVRACLNNESLDASLRQAQRHLETLSRLTQGKFDALQETLDRAVCELNEASAEVESQSLNLDFDAHTQEALEERLFALRTLARKHQVEPDALPILQEDFENRLKSLEKGSDDLASLSKQVETSRLAYLEKAQKLSNQRIEAALKLDTLVKKELAPLKLERAVFETKIEPLAESAWNEKGMDKVAFLASTNAGQTPMLISKVASGGELARFMLALKVNLASAQKVRTLIFDEVDAAIGGATAFSVGERLLRLAKESAQVLTITHSAQVASFGDYHFKVEKKELETKKVLTSVVELDAQNRIEEVARMLAGQTVTQTSRAAAIELLNTAKAEKKDE